MDQGIIAAFKLYYRQQWVSFMLHEYEAKRDPLKSVTLLHAIQWSVYAWNQKVDSKAIEKCFWKSTCISKPLNISTVDSDINDQLVRDQLQAQIISIPNLLNSLTIEEFIEPLDEQIINSESDILDTVIKSYSQDLEDKDNSDEEEIDIPRVTLSEAVQALEQLKLFQLQQETEGSLNILALERLEKDINYQKSLAFKQRTIESFFQGKRG
jgi:hypothetical protein